MNADLTFNTIPFKKTFDEKDGSERRSSLRGINTPDILSIKSQDSVNSVTKVKERRYTARVDRVVIDANLNSITVSCYYVFVVPQSAVSADISNVSATFKAMVADAGFMDAVLNNEK